MTRAELHENLMVALDTLRKNKVRSTLTVLGIVIGVTSVISVAAIIHGLNRYVASRVEKIGSRSYFVSRMSMTFGQMQEKYRKRKYLEHSYASALREACPSLANVTSFSSIPSGPGDPGSVKTPDLRYGNERVERLFLRGIEPEYLDALPLFTIAQGRAITREDVEHSRPVLVLGDAIAVSLFPNVDPVGRTVRLDGRPYEVIGVFEQDSGLFGMPGVDQFVAIPLSDFRKNYPGIREVMLVFMLDERAEQGKALSEVTDALRRLRKVSHNAEDDFEVFSPDFLTTMWKQLTGAIALLTAVISSVGLLIGGVGVMNIMLISVTERTAEIGIRKAIGARKSDIRAQFLMEAIGLTALGGVIGVACGAGVAFTVRTLVPNIPAMLTAFWVVVGVAVSVGTGLFFGYWPATRAANLDPVVCLRYE